VNDRNARILHSGDSSLDAQDLDDSLRKWFNIYVSTIIIELPAAIVFAILVHASSLGRLAVIQAVRLLRVNLSFG
jgi:hypothetical protein